jgi:hypothetical protein
MVQGLHRQRHRPLALTPAHALASDPAAHLHQAVEAATMLPRAAPAIGIEADIDQPGVEPAPLFGAIAEALQRVGAVAVQEDIGTCQQAFEHGAVLCSMQVQARAALA